MLIWKETYFMQYHMNIYTLQSKRTGFLEIKKLKWDFFLLFYLKLQLNKKWFIKKGYTENLSYRQSSKYYPSIFVLPFAHCLGGKYPASWTQRNLWVKAVSMPRLCRISQECGCPEYKRGGNLFAQGPAIKLDSTVSPSQVTLVFLSYSSWHCHRGTVDPCD